MEGVMWRPRLDREVHGWMARWQSRWLHILHGKRWKTKMVYHRIALCIIIWRHVSPGPSCPLLDILTSKILG